MTKVSWRHKGKQLLAKWLIKIGKLRYVDYEKSQLQNKILAHLPYTLPIRVPLGKGNLTIETLSLTFNPLQNHIHAQLFTDFTITSVSATLYRAHVSIATTLSIAFKSELHAVVIDQIDINEIRLIKDEYALVNQSREALATLVPHHLQNLVLGTVKSALGFLTAGVSDASLDYVSLFTNGSKQNILDYHHTQLEEKLRHFTCTPSCQYILDGNDWEEALFIKYGSHITIESDVIRFHFA
ncbi:hypothetical protein OE749_10475 [Aestuariibacter sp. AA17]|uniref:DUF1439 domain-containing protein n=1 Tax=Fluctibacter corallii TaxID=2984329 RepID=A0ABT3A8W0_9ALTE|nr:hypothetical protein [Aestuariibacter sp. AA17]MCV2885116.1 hypothetical protein [Aestuariibacter sp. AA17]